MSRTGPDAAETPMKTTSAAPAELAKELDGLHQLRYTRAGR